VIEPTFIVCCPRSGSHLLLEALSRHPDIWTIGGESHAVFARFPEMHPRWRGFESDRLNAADAHPAIASGLLAVWAGELRGSDGRRWRDLAEDERVPPSHFVEKTPNTCLKIPFLHRCFPNARFVFLHRDPRETIASLIEGWLEGARSGRFVTHRDLPGGRTRWCFFLPPGWRALADRPLAEIAAWQWRTANAAIVGDLAGLPPHCWTAVSYADLLAEPGAQLARIAAFIGVRPDPSLSGTARGSLPLSQSVLAAPDSRKWRRHEHEILALLPGVQDIAAQLASRPSV
jgi:hypothetical protein